MRTSVLIEMVIKLTMTADGDLRKGLNLVLPSLADKSQAVQLATAQVVPLFRYAEALEDLAEIVGIDVDSGLLDKSPASCGVSKGIGDACELAYLLDELCGMADLQSKQYALGLITDRVPDVDKRRALERCAELASWVTGSVVLSSASGQLREDRDDKVYERCTKDVLTCLDAVGKAISLEEKVEQRLTKRYGGSSQQKFQQQIQSLISSKPMHVFGELFWKDAVHSFERKEIDSWVDARIMAAEQELLASTQSVKTLPSPKHRMSTDPACCSAAQARATRRSRSFSPSRLPRRRRALSWLRRTSRRIRRFWQPRRGSSARRARTDRATRGRSSARLSSTPA